MITVDTEEERQFLVDVAIEAKVSLNISLKNYLGLGEHLPPHEEKLRLQLIEFLNNIPIKIKTRKRTIRRVKCPHP